MNILNINLIGFLDDFVVNVGNVHQIDDVQFKIVGQNSPQNVEANIRTEQINEKNKNK